MRAGLGRIHRNYIGAIYGQQTCYPGAHRHRCDYLDLYYYCLMMELAALYID